MLKKYPCQNTWEEKKCIAKSMKKIKEKKERNKDSSYFWIKGITQKGRDSSFKGIQKKYFKIRKL